MKLSRTPGDRARARPRRSASTPRRCSREAGFATRRSTTLLESGAAAGPRRGGERGARSWADERAHATGAAEDLRARRARRRAGRDGAPLPARGPAAGAGQDLAQHGLLPARVRRADPADQAAAGGAVHAAAGDPRAARRRRRRPRAAARARRDRRRARRPGARARARAHARGGGPASGSRSPSGRCGGSTEVGVLSPDDDGYSPTDVRIIEAVVALPRGRLERDDAASAPATSPG